MPGTRPRHLPENLRNGRPGSRMSSIRNHLQLGQNLRRLKIVIEKAPIGCSPEESDDAVDVADDPRWQWWPRTKPCVIGLEQCPVFIGVDRIWKVQIVDDILRELMG